MARAAKASSELQALAGTGILTNDHGLIISHCASHCGQRTRQKSPRARHPSSPGPWAAHPTTLIHILQALPVSDSSANQSRATPQPRSQRLRPFRFSSLLIDYSLRGGKRRSCRPWPCDSAFLRLPLVSLPASILTPPGTPCHRRWTQDISAAHRLWLCCSGCPCARAGCNDLAPWLRPCEPRSRWPPCDCHNRPRTPNGV